MRVFWPILGVRGREGNLLGWKTESSVVVATIREESSSSGHAPSASEGIALQIVGRVRLIGQSENEQDENADELVIWVNSSGLPISSSVPIQLVLFTPPDPSRLRFLRLGGEGHVSRTTVEQEMCRQDGYGRMKRKSSDDLVAVIPLLNNVYDAQGKFRSRSSRSTGLSSVSTTQTAASEAASSRRGWKDGGLGSITRHSAVATQLSLRYKQVLSAPTLFKRTRHHPGISVATRSEHYMRFWNTVWLILNDLILGYCTRQFLLLLQPTVVDTVVPVLSRFIVDLPQSALHWLNDWPIGLKLNTPLSSCFTTIHGRVLQIWAASALPFLNQHLPTLYNIIALTPLGGLTLLLSAVRDAMSLLTLHLHLSHLLSSTLCTWQISSLGGLWNLFRGKRWNVLRQRTDSYAYDVDQLFLGTLLFTVSIFLLPTVAIYAGLFAVIRVLVILVDRTLGLVITALNAFPLFELMLRFKEPSRLPSGVIFEVQALSHSTEHAGDHGKHPISHALRLRNAPKSISDILRQ